MVNLRALEPTDLDTLFKWENDPKIWQVSNTIAPFSKYLLQQYIESATKDIYETRQLRLIIESSENKTPVGAIDLFDYEPMHSRAGIGILIAEDEHRNKGYGSAALEKLISYSFHTLLLHQLYCNINTSNEQSIKLFERFGFRTIGVKKDWILTSNGWEDILLMQLINKSLNT